MAIVFALEKLFDDVKARFDTEGTAVENLFGWRKPNEKLERGNRISWYPGAPSGGSGPIAPPRHPGNNPRKLFDKLERFTAIIVGFDATAAEDERKQYNAVRVIEDAFLRALHLAAYGNVELDEPEWVTAKVLRRHGAALQYTGTIRSPVFDVPAEVAPADAHAEIDVEELDVTETVSTEVA